MRTKLLHLYVLSVAAGLAGCSGADNSSPVQFGGATGIAGAPTTGGVLNVGGSTAKVSSPQSGGTPAFGGSPATGGTPSAGGTTAVAAGGALPMGGRTGTGGTTSVAAGGKAEVGGFPAIGGTTAVAAGGKSATGGFPATGGTTAVAAGGKSATGGFPATGGTTAVAAGGTKATGGTPATGGATASTSPTVNCSGTALTGGTQHCSSSAQGTVNGVGWSIWSSGSGGCMTTYGQGSAFKATWNNSGDFLARMGFQWDETKTYDQYGTISADYSYTKTGSGGGYSFIGIYGWSNNPLIEFYIVDDWFGNGPPTGGGTLKGTFTVDGGTYKVYTHTQNNQPSIHGNATFPQFFSVRQTARQCGHISVSEHFKQWATYGMTLGKMYEAKLLVEAGGGQGSIDYSLGTMTAK